jgi:hypothetical protein
VWSSDFGSTSQSSYLVKGADLTASGGVYTLTLQPGHVYTVTTTTGQGAGAAVSPSRSVLALPYSAAISTTNTGSEVPYLSAMNGAFEAEPCLGGRSGSCVQQLATQAPISWDNASDPYALLGELSWSDYTVSVDTLLRQSGSAVLLGRAGVQKGFSPADIDAYQLKLSDSGAWSLQRNSSGGTVTTLASGTVAAPGTGTWHTLALTFAGSGITARIDGAPVGSVTDASYGSGQVGIGTSGWIGAQFANLNVTPGATTDLSGTYVLVNRNSGLAMDAKGQGTADGTPIIQWTRNGGTNQEWTLAPAGGGYYTVTGVASGKALDIPNVSSVEATGLDLWTANGGVNQQWLVTPSGNGYYSLESRSDAELVDVNGGSTTAGATVLQWPLNGGSNQQWQLVKVG